MGIALVTAPGGNSNSRPSFAEELLGGSGHGGGVVAGADFVGAIQGLYGGVRAGQGEEGVLHETDSGAAFATALLGPTDRFESQSQARSFRAPLVPRAMRGLRCRPQVGVIR